VAEEPAAHFSIVDQKQSAAPFSIVDQKQSAEQPVAHFSIVDQKQSAAHFSIVDQKQSAAQPAARSAEAEDPVAPPSTVEMGDLRESFHSDPCTLSLYLDAYQQVVCW
jgi:hypothetical protein